MERKKIAGSGSPQELATYFQIVGGNRMNGIFVIIGGGKQYQLLFYDGRLIYAESEPERRDEALLDYLASAKIIKEEEKGELLKEKRKKRVSIVTLVLEKTKEAEKLKKAMYARTFEIIFEITTVPTIKFEFIERRKNEIGFNPKVFRPLNVEGLIMDAMRIQDELSTVPAEATEENAVPVMVEAPDEKELERLRIPPQIIEFIDKKRTIREIARECTISKYEAMLYVGELIKRGYADIEEVKEEIVKEKKTREGMVISIVRNIVTLLFLAGAGFGGYYLKGGQRPEVVYLRESREKDVNVMKQMIKIKSALYAYKYIYGKYPDSLKILVDKGFLTDKDLTFPKKEVYYYQKIEGKGYELLP